MAAEAIGGEAVEQLRRAEDAAVHAAQSQVENYQARMSAIRFAEQTGGRVAKVQFLDGRERWVVFNAAGPTAAFPPFSGDLREALANHRLDRLKIRSPRSARAALPLVQIQRHARHLGGRVVASIRSRARALQDGAAK